jgi:hypothetical protein
MNPVQAERAQGTLTTPDMMPPDPKPAIARPRMKAIELGAAPQRAEPVSNRSIDVKNVALTLNIVYNFPNTN